MIAFLGTVTSVYVESRMESSVAAGSVKSAEGLREGQAASAQP